MSLRDDEYVHVRSLIASIHRPKNVARPPELAPPNSPATERGSPASSDTDRSGTGSDLSDIRTKDEVVHAPRSKSNSIAGTSLAPPGPGQQEERRRRRPSLLHLQTERGGLSGPQSAGPYLTVPRFTVTAPPGEHHHRRFSHAFHGFALRRHSNTSLHRSESMVSLAYYKTLTQLVNDDNTAELQQYLANNKNINVDDRDENNATALMVACERGRAEAVRLLVAAGADPSTADADGWGPLALAARAGHAPVVRELLDAGAKVDSRDCGGWTPLMWASYKGHEEVVALLLEKGADVHAHGNYNINSLVWAAGRRHSGVVAQLLTAGARPSSCDKYATSALTWAARAGDTASCAALLRAGADPNTAGMYCWTPLLQATHGNHFEIVQMLLEYRPNVNALDKDGFTALAIACKEGYYDIALALINSGAYINIQDHSKDTPLIHAVKGGHKNIVEALLKKHVDVDLQGKDKKTPVYTAVEKGHISILKLLLASNPDLELTTNTGDTPLLRAVRSRNSEMVQLLLERKARVTATDYRGDTALHIAMRARSKQIVEILLRNPKHSQLLYKPNKQNETPYNIDMSYNKTILGQIFGARKINTNEDAENMLGYELYSAALADMLSEPSLSVPITVGLYARWGSGKSFLLSKLKEEMKNFARQWSETGWSWSWAVAWAAWHAALFIGAVAAVAGAAPHAAVAVCFALFAVFYLALYLFWNLGNKYEWWWAGGVLTAMGRRFSSLLLILQVVFCHPPGPNDPRALPAMPIRFHFTEGMKSGGGQEGETMVVQMIASLAEALECQYGRVCTRLARAFKPSPISSTSGWRWRRVCCIPHIITFELCFTTILGGLCVLILYLIERNVEEERREIQQGLMIGACALAAVVVLANLYTWGRVLGALLLGPRFRLMRALKRDAPTLALRPEVQALTHMVSCLDAFTGQQTRLVVVVDALDSCEQDKVLALLNAVHALCSDPGSPFILLLAIDPHIISKAVEVNSKRAFSESNIGGWDYLRNMVQLPFYLQNSALRRVKIAQQVALRRMQTANAEDFASLQRSVSARRLSSTSELMSSQERIKPQAAKDASGGSATAASRARRLRPSESVASSMASGLHRAGAPPGGAADLGRVLLTDDYFSDVNPRSMRRLMNVLYITGRLLKAFQIEFNWYQLASWVNLTEQWPFRTSWIIYHHETYEEHIDDSTSLKKIYEKVRPNMNSLRETGALAELDRDERKLEVFLNFHRSTLTAADLKIFLPFTINLDPYIKKVIKEEQMQAGAEDETGTTAALSMPWTTSQSKHPHSKLFQRKHKSSAPIAQSVASGGVTPPMWMGWPNIGPSYVPPSLFPPVTAAPATNPITVLKTAFPDLGDVSSLRLSTLSMEQVCVLVRAALNSDIACAILQQHHICGMVLTHCDLRELRPVLNLPFGDWELFKMLITNLRELENNMPTITPSVTVLSEKNVESEPDSVKPRPVLEHQRSRTSNMEKQVTLEEQMICGALQTLNEEALEDVLQADPAPDEDTELQLPLPVSVSSFGGNSTNASPLGTPRGPRREISILKGGSFRRRAPALPDPPAVTFNVENEEDSDDGHITFSARPCLRTPSARPLAVTVQYAAPVPRPVVRSRPSSLLVTYDDAGELSENGPLATRSRSVEDSIKNSPAVDFKLRNIRKTADILKKVSSAERLTKLKEKIMSVGTGSRDRSPARDDTISDDESAPLVSPGIVSPTSIAGGPAADASCPAVRSVSSLHSKSAQSSPTKKVTILGIECREPSLQDCTQSTEFSPRSEISQLDSPRETLLDFDILPEAKTGSNGGESQSHRSDIIREESQESMSNMIEPYNMRLLAHGTSETGRALWRQDAIDAGPPWPWDDPDSAV